MKIKIKKFGGISLSSPNLLRNAAQIIKNDLSNGFMIVVVVSAASGYTNALINQISEITTKHFSKEEDVILASGEQISAGMMSIMLNTMGIKSRSFLGWQVPIITNDIYRNADVINVEIKNIINCLQQNIIPVIAGFQGIDVNGNITTLGRGGSDITAMSLAHVLQAHKCEIYKDVDGMYVADPKIINVAHKINNISYKLMLDATILGAKILHHKAVAKSMECLIPTEILSFNSNNAGTHITANSDDREVMIFTSRKDIVAATTNKENISKINNTQMIFIADLTKEIDKILFYGSTSDFIIDYFHKQCSLCSTELLHDLGEVSMVMLNININIKETIFLLEKSGFNIIAFRKNENSISFITQREKTEQLIHYLYEKKYCFL